MPKTVTQEVWMKMNQGWLPCRSTYYRSACYTAQLDSSDSTNTVSSNILRSCLQNVSPTHRVELRLVRILEGNRNFTLCVNDLNGEQVRWIIKTRLKLQEETRIKEKNEVCVLALRQSRDERRVKFAYLIPFWRLKSCIVVRIVQTRRKSLADFFSLNALPPPLTILLMIQPQIVNQYVNHHHGKINNHSYFDVLEYDRGANCCSQKFSTSFLSSFSSCYSLPYSLVQWNWSCDVTDACNSGASGDQREPISLHQAVHLWPNGRN